METAWKPSINDGNSEVLLIWFGLFVKFYQVHGDEKLVELALADMLARVVDVEEDHGRQGHAVHHACRGHQGSQPPSAVGLFIITVKEG